jgi:hypothetical protein
VLAFRGFNGDLSKTIDGGNLNIEKNFANILLKRSTDFPQEFNAWGIGWNQFNENGYVSGLLNYLMKGGGPEIGQSKIPLGGLLDGWEKDIPIAFFEAGLYSTATEKELMDVIFGDHPAREYKSESAATDPQGFISSEEIEELSLDP